MDVGKSQSGGCARLGRHGEVAEGEHDHKDTITGGVQVDVGSLGGHAYLASDHCSLPDSRRNQFPEQATKCTGHPRVEHLPRMDADVVLTRIRRDQERQPSNLWRTAAAETEESMRTERPGDCSRSFSFMGA